MTNTALIPAQQSRLSPVVAHSVKISLNVVQFDIHDQENLGYFSIIFFLLNGTADELPLTDLYMSMKS